MVECEFCEHIIYISNINSEIPLVYCKWIWFHVCRTIIIHEFSVLSNNVGEFALKLSLIRTVLFFLNYINNCKDNSVTNFM